MHGMAEIKPIRAWRYNQELSKNIESCLSPLFDVVTERQREALYQNPVNSIHLSAPKNPLQAPDTLKAWKKQGIIEQDYIPGIYPYYQIFNLPGGTGTYCRKGFICFIKAYDWNEGVVLRHENTIPPAVQERVELLKSTELNASATHGLYADPSFELEEIMDGSMINPVIATEDYQGIQEKLSIIHDSGAIKKFVEVLKQQKVILADGHHRYQGSIDYRKYRSEQNPHHTGKEAYNYHMMFLSNMEAKDVRILATHRLVKNLPDLSVEDFKAKASEFFHITEINTPYELNEIILGKKATFGILMKDHTFKISLKPDLYQSIDWPFPDMIKQLDLTILHYFILQEILGIPGEEQRSSSNIDYDRNFTDCVTRVKEGASQMAVITNELTMDIVKKVCFSGYTLPQKSTYFYPKVICGLLFGSINEDEFQLSSFPGF
ncbi:MAG: hypothetical protein DHS20C17_18860 [Cyclobacteriaceae bacterium]|nr:MAG: hypothetical protein DHS20C17_18860 [Cyclobacteriaceae bacterium]